MQTYHSDLLVDESSGEESNLFNEYFRLKQELNKIQEQLQPLRTQEAVKAEQIHKKWNEIKSSKYKPKESFLFVYRHSLFSMNEYGDFFPVDVKKF